jgi:arylsulfatase A
LNVRDNPDNPIELYDLDNDPSEQTNIAREYPDVVEKITEIMSSAHVPSEVFPLYE